MMDLLKRFTGIALFILLWIVPAGLLMSCGRSAAEENQLEIRPNGTIIADSFSEFPKEQYNITLFEEEAKESVKTYNEEAGSRRIRFLSVSLKEDIAHLTMQYRSWEDYQAFNDRDLYYGTVQDGLDNLQLTGSTKLRSAEGTESVTLRELGTMENEGKARWRILAVCESAVIRHRGTPAYISENVTVEEDGTVRANGNLSQGDLPETAYIVYKK